MTDEEKVIDSVIKFYEIFKKHENVESVANFVMINNRYNELSEEFTKLLCEDIERMGQTYGANIKKIKKALKENGNLEEKIYNIILAEEEKRDISKEKEYLEKFTKSYKELSKVQKDITEYIKHEKLDEDFKGIVMYTLNENKKECEFFIKALKDLVKKYN